MNVLVAVASRHGSTWEIGGAIAEALRSSGFLVDLVDPEDVDDVTGHDAVLLGSSVYAGRWSAGARAMAERLAPALASRPVWLFSSGPVGVPPTPTEELDEVERLAGRLGARGHRVFAGRIARHGLGLAERAVLSLLRVPDGDFRDWDDIDRWAVAVAAELHSEEIRRSPAAR
jgi:menaquinone-dependent protoporphyrinogen oxidase